MITKRKPKIVVLGMMSRHSVAGMIFITMQYVIGFKRLGYDVYYVEPQGGCPGQDAKGPAAWIDTIMRRFDLGDKWAYHAVHSGGECYGLSLPRLRHLLASADIIINLHGATKPTEELSATGRLVYLETDPVELEVALYKQEQWAFDFLEPHCAFFSWGENYGRADCKLPVPERFTFRPTRQPIIVDLWHPFHEGPAQAFTTIGNWRQEYREVEFQGEIYYWSKHFEFLKFLDLPEQTGQSFELALSTYGDSDRLMLEQHGWRVVPAASLSYDVNKYQAYVGASRGEFSVAKDQNVRLHTGWFSDRSAAYLAAARPVINQETGFSNTYPTGQGLFAFTTMDDIISAVDSINSDYKRHCAAALELAREYFSYEVVLPRLVTETGLVT
jgi:hypothetical protein